MNDIKRICIFCESWESGGIEAFLHSVLCEINIANLEIDIVISELKESVFSHRLKEIGINFYELSKSQKKIIKNYRLISKLFKERKYDLIHMNIFHAVSFIYAIAAQKNGIKTRIAHSHNTKIGRCKSYPLKRLLHEIFKTFYYKIFTDFWACSTAAAKFMFPKKVGFELIKNGIESERFVFREDMREKIRNRLNINDKPLLINVGRLCEQKNQTFLLDVTDELKKQGYDCVLALIGEGDMLLALKEKAKRLGLLDRVIFLGIVSDVENILSAGDIFLFPSIFEGFGIAALEAQASGLSVICSEHIPKEAFVTENIRAVSLSGGKKKWAYEITEALNRPIKRYDFSEAIKKNGFDIKETIEKIESKYHER